MNVLGRLRVATLLSAVSSTQNGTLTLGDAVEGGYAFAVFQVTGTFTATVAFEGTVDGSNWVVLEAVSVTDSTSIVTTSVSAAGMWRVNVLGLAKVRAKVTWTSGTSVTVTAGLIA
jgi:hypothetical protein